MPSVLVSGTGQQYAVDLVSQKRVHLSHLLKLEDHPGEHQLLLFSVLYLHLLFPKDDGEDILLDFLLLLHPKKDE